MELGWSFFILKRWNHALTDTICHALAASLFKKTFLPFVVLEECEHCLKTWMGCSLNEELLC